MGIGLLQCRFAATLTEFPNQIHRRIEEGQWPPKRCFNPATWRGCFSDYLAVRTHQFPLYSEIVGDDRQVRRSEDLSRSNCLASTNSWCIEQANSTTKIRTFAFLPRSSHRRHDLTRQECKANRTGDSLSAACSHLRRIKRTDC